LRREQERNWWQRYAGDIATAAYQWGVPTQAVLDQACALRTKLDAQLAGALKTSADKMRLVVGHAKSTPDGFEMGSEGLMYLDLQDGGDGRVPLASALVTGVATWTLDCEHGSLPSAKGAFDAFADLLVQRSDCVMSTAAHALDSVPDYTNPNVVKVVLDGAGRALYFSRAPLPWWRDGHAHGITALPAPAPLRHIGLYAYRAGFLRGFPALPPSPLEQIESLEQLRVLWHGLRIAVHVSSEPPGPGVDTPQDLERVRALWASG